MTTKSNIFGDLPKKPIKQTIEDNRLVERVESQNLSPFKRGSFETYEDYRKRLTEAFQYNISIGTVTLSDKNYDVETKKFFVNIQYQQWFKQICTLETNKRFYIEIEAHEAKSLYYDYESYELVAQFEVNYECGIAVTMDKKVKVLIKRIWLISKAKNILNNRGIKFSIEDDIAPIDYLKYLEKINSNLILCSKLEERREKYEEYLWKDAIKRNNYTSYLYLTPLNRYSTIAIDNYKDSYYKKQRKELVDIVIGLFFIFIAILSYIFFNLQGLLFILFGGVIGVGFIKDSIERLIENKTHFTPTLDSFRKKKK